MEVETYFERKWSQYLDFTTRDAYIQYCVWTNLFMTAAYWSIGLFYVLLDVVNPKWSQKYKVQVGKNEPVERRRLMRVLFRVFFNQIVVGPFFVTFFFPLIRLRGMHLKIHTLPTVPEFVVHFIGCIVVREFYFYYSHRVLHMKQFYERFHKKHHEWTAPIAVSAIYCTPLEHIFSNIGPVGLGPFVFGSHFITNLAFALYAVLMTLQDHSGYHFPYYFNPKWHDDHHEKFYGNYGIHAWIDRLHGTDQESVLQRKQKL